LSLVGLRFYFRTTGRGALHCQRCGGDRQYRRCVGRRWFHVLYVPLIPLERVAEHVQCRSCRTRYRVEVLAIPTMAAMEEALPAGALAAVTTMLLAGDPASPAARNRAMDVLLAAGLTGYDDAALTVDLALSDGPGSDIAAPLGRLAVQLTTPAPEWFLTDVVRVGLADGPLSDEEREAARLIASHLGMTAAQAHGVIVMAEESAAAG
jgi:hypothetical protein